jgi:hypothetical protein
MSTIKSPQPLSQSKNHGSHGGGGFVVFLIILTWIVIGGFFYGIKSGIIKAEEANSPVTEKIEALESNIAALDARFKSLEKRIADASSALNPALQAQPADGAMKPEELMQMAPVKPEAGAAVVPPVNQQIQLPKIDITPEDKAVEAPVKPQTDNRDKSDSESYGFEKKSSI